MNLLVFHIASGHAFFTGMTLVLLAVLLSTWEHPVAKRIIGVTFFIGLIAIVVSAAAIPYWSYALLGLAMVAWITSLVLKKWQLPTRVAFVCVCLLAVGFEIPYHFNGRLQRAPSRSLTVIGDSITAGMGDRFERWPELLAKEHDLTVQDISYPGDTAKLALERAKAASIQSPVVVVEIGGNDLLLGGGSTQRFRRDLDALLTYLAAPNRQIVMFELPLPPFQNEFGRIQRELASKHNVILAPKLQLLSVLADKESTVDTIHLTKLGHRRMANCVWNLVGSAYERK